MIFENRREAGRQLAEALRRYQDEEPVVIALPRGGVEVGAEVARRLGAPLDVMVVRKLRAPHQPELAIGAVADPQMPHKHIERRVIDMLGVPDEYLDREVGTQLEQANYRETLYRAGHPQIEVRGKTAIVIDDGVATGSTARVALQAVRSRHPRRLLLAVPVASREAFDMLSREADGVVCLSAPEEFMAVGQFYRDFGQVEDDEVIRLLDVSRQPAGRAQVQETPAL